jgi:glycosyltransferase involved in cell wall biosynthesis
VALTVRNEEASMARLLDALLAQRLRPEEIVVADGGSSDRTADIVQDYARRGEPVRLVSVPGACRGRGRNAALAASRHELVALIDGGCVPDPAWLERLWAAWQATPGCEVVFGSVRPLTYGPFTEGLSTASFPATRLPRGRRIMSYSVASMLIQRRVWERLGGFVEGFRTGEDVLFVQRVCGGSVKPALAPEAVVSWEIPRTSRQAVGRLARYSQYTLEAGLGRTWHAATRPKRSRTSRRR